MGSGEWGQKTGKDLFVPVQVAVRASYGNIMFKVCPYLYTYQPTYLPAYLPAYLPGWYWPHCTFGKYRTGIVALLPVSHIPT